MTIDVPTRPLLQPVSRKRRWVWQDALLFAALAAISIFSGFGAVPGTSYWSTAQVFADFMNSPLRIVFPLAVAVVAGGGLASQFTQRFIVNTRSREDVRRRLSRWLLFVCARVFVLFGLLAVVNAAAAFVLVPVMWPHVVDAAGYDLHNAAAVHRADIAIAPLTSALSLGWFPFSLLAGLWLGGNAVVFALVTFVCVLTIRRTVAALIAPLAVYLGEGVVLAVVGIPGSSFLVSAVYPAGLQQYDIAQAVIPTLVLGVGGIAASAFLISRARTSARMS